jgi:hypothetical protein
MLVSRYPRSVNFSYQIKSTLKPKKYLKNRRGQKIGVVLDIGIYRSMIADIEELEASRAYDTAKISGDECISFQKVTREIERSRR